MSPMYRPIYSNNRFTIKYDTILLFFLAILIFLWSNGFNLSIFDFSDRFNLLNLFGLLLIVFFAGHSMLFVSWKQYSRNYYFWCIVGMLATALFPTFVNLVIVKGLSPIEVLRSGLRYCGLFIFILLISCRTSSSFVAKLNALVLGIATVNVLSLIALSFFPAVADSLFVKTMERFGSIRLQIFSVLTPMAQYAFCYALVICTKDVHLTKKKVFYLLLFGIYFWYFFVIALGRRTILALLMVISYYIVFHLRGRYKFRAIFALPFILLLFLVVPRSTVILDSIKSSYTSSVEEYQYGEGNVGIRVRGIDYYSHQFKESGYLGIGLGSNRLQLSDPYRLGMERYRYNSNDHGIFAVLYMFGFPGIVLTVIFLFHIFRDLAIIRRRGSPEHQSVAMAIHLFLVFSIVALLQIFWKPSLSLWTGLIFFMVWRMREGIASNDRALPKKQKYPRYPSSKNGEIS